MDELDLAILRALEGPNTSPSLVELAHFVERGGADVLEAVEQLELLGYVLVQRKSRLGGHAEKRYMLTGDGRKVLRQA